MLILYRFECHELAEQCPSHGVVLGPTVT